MKFFSLIYQGDVHLPKEKKILSQEEYSSLIEAKLIIDKAREDAKQLLEETKKKCEELQQEAKDRGFQEGLVQFNEKIVSLDEEFKKFSYAMQQNILPIALKAAKKIVGKELEQFPETIVDIVIQALAPASESHKIVIYVNKEDKAALEGQESKLRKLLPHLDVLAVQEKEDITRGGCIIKTEGGLINATIENQWDALARAFDKYLKNNSNMHR